MAGTAVVHSHRQVVQVGGPQSVNSIHLPATASHLLPVTSFTAEEVITPLLDNGRRGPMAADFQQPAGVKLVNISIEGAVQSDPGTGLGFGVGLFLRNIFGGVDVATSITNNLWNHDFQLPAVPAIEYLSIENGDTTIAAGNRTFTGCRVQELVFAWNAGEGLLTYTATLTGAAVSIGAIANLNAQAATLEPAMEGWRPEVAFDAAWNPGTAEFTKMISAEWTLSRPVSVLYTGQNTQVANQIMLGPLACTVAMVMDFDNTVELVKYRAASEVKITNAFVKNRSANNSTIRRFIIGNSTFSLIDNPVTVDVTGEHATIAIGARAMYNTDASVIITDASITGDASMSLNAGPVHVRLTDLKTAVYGSTG